MKIGQLGKCFQCLCECVLRECLIIKKERVEKPTVNDATVGKWLGIGE